MESDRRLTLEEIETRHPNLIRALREHPHIGWLLVRSGEHGAVVLGPNGSAATSSEDRVEGEDPLAPFSPNARGCTCCAPTASRTSPTSWSAASTTPSSTRAAPSRS